MNIQLLMDAKVVAVIRHATADNIVKPVLALIKGGVKGIEITVENNGGYEAIKKLASLKEDFYLGAGTVLNKSMAKKAIQAGATFVVSPILDQEVIQEAHDSNVLAIPGVLTPTEIHQAIMLGADMVKIFPVINMGASYVKNIKAPLPNIPIMVTGGVTLDNAHEFHHADVLGLGSQLIDLSKTLDDEGYDTITNNAMKIMNTLKK